MYTFLFAAQDSNEFVVIFQKFEVKRSNSLLVNQSFPPYEDLKIPDMLFTSHTLHITLGNKQCLKLLLGVRNTIT
jgi:hypothetical protein